MIDLKLIEDNADMIKKNLSKRKFETSLIDEINVLNHARKQFIKIVEEGRSKVKNLSQEVGNLKKQGKDATNLMNEVAKIKTDIEDSEKKLGEVQIDIDNRLMVIPNLLADDVPQGASEADNKEVSRWGTPKKFDFPVKDHTDLGEKLGMLDFEIAAKMTGSRFVVYKDQLARLERAIANYMIDFHLKRGYEEIMPPYIVHERALVGTGQLPKFKQDLFKIEGMDWYLIPTSEVPVTNLKREEIFSATELPLKYVSYTPCFRSEAGSYGKDTKGLIRMHQFNKVEMVCITSAEDSKRAHEEMIKSACDILEELKLPYRALLLCSADIGFGSQKTIDLEVWLPSQNTYREISSISNCWDFQARRAQIRYKAGEGKPQFAHTLNGSGLAVGRTLVAILENCQTAEGFIEIPKVLVPYMGGIEVIKPKIKK